MGVVRERKVVCESARNVPSNPESTTNSGYNTQDSEDEESQEQLRPPRRQPLRTFRGLNLNFNHNITRHTGKRKVRRVLNIKFLETLMEEIEDDGLMENSKSKFQILMENTDDAIEFLNRYDIQRNENSLKHCDDNEISCMYSNPYLNIPRKIRAAISSRKNFQYDLLKSIEVKLVYNFYPLCSHPDFVYCPETCYERLLVHAVAKYNGFISETVTKDDTKVVKIICIETSFTPRDQLLCDYIEDMRSKNIHEDIHM